MINVNILGLDSSHTIEFARRLVATDCPQDQHVEGATVRKVMRFETPFQDATGLDMRQKQLEAWGIKVTTDLADAIDDCDAIILCINDPSLHLEYFCRIANLGKPIFVDKPLADSVANAKQILETATKNNTAFFSCSSLRFVPQLIQACAKVASPSRVSTFGPLGQAPAGSSIIWYGVHSVEMMQCALGRGAATVRAVADDMGVILMVDYNDSRKGLVELCHNSSHYGGSLRGREAAAFIADTSRLYSDLLRVIIKFFESLEAPVHPLDALEITAILEAADKSVKSGNVERVDF
ncbi:MAG: Gfo/Idh/MocA family protein [Armatimonadota bacterium]